MAERTVQELGEELKRLLGDYARAYADFDKMRDSGRVNKWRAEAMRRSNGAAAAAHDAIDHLTSRLSAAEAKLAEVEKDAERWRWLRTNRTTALEATALHAYQSDAHMEAAIDAAMQGANK